MAAARLEKEKPRNLLIREALQSIIYSPQEIELKFKYPTSADDDNINPDSCRAGESEGGEAAAGIFFEGKVVNNSSLSVREDGVCSRWKKLPGHSLSNFFLIILPNCIHKINKPRIKKPLSGENLL